MDEGSVSLELSDPTPDVRALFQVFDARFFWGSLGAVAVRWSRRMYSCAGICRYEGRAGFCEIALSEPLLKLRSRKNLVETLLHEMIHAYLFVASNERDRDGHGPNFIRHMHRINKLANLNISIYHNFVDEVDLYKTHWWRCNGACQSRRPYYGIVRRTCNRAPGPNDFWWQTHQNVCGGTFIKIKEPEKKSKKRKAVQDIRKYWNPTQIKIHEAESDLSNCGSKKSKTNPKNSGKTNLIQDVNTAYNEINTRKPKLFSEIESSVPVTNVADVVRNRWCQKYADGNISTVNTATNILSGNVNNLNKIVPVTKYQNEYTDKNKNPTESENKISTCNEVFLVSCPLCDLQTPYISLEEHVSVCIRSTELNNEFSKSPSDVVDLTDISYENSKNGNFPCNSQKEKELSNYTMACPVCDKNISKFNIEEHLEECLNNTFETDCSNSMEENNSKSLNVSIISVSDTDDDDIHDKKISGKAVIYVPCPSCLNLVDETKINDHLDECLQ